MAVRPPPALRGRGQHRQVPRRTRGLRRVPAGGADPRRLRLRQGIPRRAAAARSDDHAHRADHRAADPVVHRREGAGPAQVILTVLPSREGTEVIKRDLFSEEHDAFRDMVRKFIENEIAPHHAAWERDGIVSRDLWLKAGAAGMLCCTIPEEYGGAGADYLFDVVVFEEMARSGYTAPGFMIHCDLVATYVKSFGTEAQKTRWLPKMVRGEAIGALGMTEPHAGSDLNSIRTKAVRHGDDFVISGQKGFISNGQLCDVIVLATKTDSQAGAQGATPFP